MRKPTLEIDQGTTQAYTVQLRGPDGADIAADTYSSPTLALSLWTGDQNTAITLSASTVGSFNATTNQCTVTLHQTDFAVASTTIVPGTYHLRVTLTSGGVAHTAAHALVSVFGTAGSTTAGAVYNTFARVADVAPWIRNLIKDSPDIQSDLGEWRADARRWFNRQIMSRVRAKLDDFQAGHAVCLDAVDDEEPDWLDFTWDEAESTYDEILASTLTFLAGTYVADTDAGLVDSDGQVAEICAYYTAYLAGRNQIGKEGETTYQEFAMGCGNTASMRLAGYVAKIYTDDTDAPYIYLRA